MIETDRTGRYSSTTGSETKHGLLVPVHQTLPGRGRRSGQNMPVRLRRRSSVFRGTARLVGVGLLADPSCGRTFGRADREIGPYAIVRDRHPSAKNGGPGLRRTTAEDLDFVLAAEGDEENLPFIGQWSREQDIGALQDGDTAHMVVERIEDGERVGCVILTGLADLSQGIRLRRICVTHKGKGYGREALRLAKQVAFEDLNAPRLWLMVRSHNVRAQRLYELAGFVREGPRRPCTEVGAGSDSANVMAMLKPEHDG